MGVLSWCHLQAGLLLLMISALPGYQAVDPNAPMLAQRNRNGDLVLRNVAIRIPSRINEILNIKSMAMSCMPPSRFPPPELSVSLQCYKPYSQHHVYRGRVATTKSGKPCKVSALG